MQPRKGLATCFLVVSVLVVCGGRICILNEEPTSERTCTEKLDAAFLILSNYYTLSLRINQGPSSIKMQRYVFIMRVMWLNGPSPLSTGVRSSAPQYELLVLVIVSRCRFDVPQV